LVPSLIAAAQMSDDRRREHRSPISGPLLYGKSNESLGVTANVSDSGACFYTAESMSKGSTLTCHSKAFGNGPVQARVAWCAEVAIGLYKVGISFQ
jgi:hypothetical protein